MTDSQPGRDEQKRAAALHLARGGDDPAARELLQRGKTKAVRFRIVMLVGSIAVGVVFGFAFSHRGITISRGSRVAHWRTVAGPALIIAGLLLEIVVIVGWFRSGRFKAGWRSPSLALSRGQRRQLLRQIRGRAVVDQSMLPVSRRLAKNMRGQRSLIGIFVALPMVLLGEALPHNIPYRWWMAIAMCIVYAVLGVLVFLDTARAERFLQQTQ